MTLLFLGTDPIPGLGVLGVGNVSREHWNERLGRDVRHVDEVVGDVRG